jgi:restriction system protein
MIPDFQTLLRPVLEVAEPAEIKMKDVVARLTTRFELNEEERNELLPSGRAKMFDNRVHWARFHLKQAGLLESERRGYISITEKGRSYLKNGPARITVADLKKLQSGDEDRGGEAATSLIKDSVSSAMTPDELMRVSHKEVIDAVASDLLDRVRAVDPGDFEKLIVSLLSKMGYGHSEDAGSVLGGAGDDGVDGVINLDPLGVDQVYVQAKRYQAASPIGSGAIRDFYGALGLKDVTKGIFVTTSTFTPSARSTAEKLGARLVLIDGPQLARLMVGHEVGCRVTEVFRVSVVEESYFE